MLTTQVHADTHVGKQRTENQDSLICQSPFWGRDSLSLLAVIDGVGGYAGGEVAAQIARDTILHYLNEYQTGERSQLLKEAITEANNRIADERTKDSRLARMSCVLTVAIADAEKRVLHVGHVGDTRLYVYRNGALTKLSHDHSVVGYREETGELTEQEAMTHPQRNEVLRVLGEAWHRPMDEHFIETIEWAYQPNDMVLICSDGLSDLVTKAAIERILQRKTSLSEKTQALIDAANQAGGKDNITVILATYQDPSSKPLVQPPVATIKPVQVTEPLATSPKVAEDSGHHSSSNWTAISIFGLMGSLIGAVLMWVFLHQTPPAEPDPVPARVFDLKEKALLEAIMANDTLSWTKDSTQTDTIRLSQTLVLPDTLHWLEKGKLVLMPLDSLTGQAAIQIRDTSSIHLQNLHFVGFEAGILANERASVLLNNCSASTVLFRTDVLNLPPKQTWQLRTILQKK